MGFNNDGVTEISLRLRNWHNQRSAFDSQRVLIGGNIGKNKLTPNEDAWKDYEICFNELFNRVDYFVVNVSSPNTPGLRELQQKDSLRKILTNLQTKNYEKSPGQKPLLLKISPDLTPSELDDIIDLAIEIKLDGIIVSNTTTGRENLITKKIALDKIGSGGLSGKPLQQISTNLVHYIATKTNSQLPIIASGGIFTSANAAEKIMAGAILLQVWTGFIYEGPSVIKKICTNLPYLHKKT
jgi:dihydroorotate dehydrogenase